MFSHLSWVAPLQTSVLSNVGLTKTHINTDAQIDMDIDNRLAALKVVVIKFVN
jgi:hypothetical protein